MRRRDLRALAGAPGHLGHRHRVLQGVARVVVPDQGPGVLREDRVREVGDDDPHVGVAEIDPDDDAGRGLRASKAPGLPCRGCTPVSVPSVSTTKPSWCSAATTLETVARERPSDRARSARVSAPRVRSSSMTRSRFPVRACGIRLCTGCCLHRCHPSGKS